VLKESLIILARSRTARARMWSLRRVALQDHADVSRNFIRLTRILLDGGNDLAIATHDEQMIEATLEHAEMHRIPRERFGLQMLYGVRRDLQRQLVRDGYTVRVYIPFGEQWYPYLMRRLAERPANLFFLAGSVVRETPLRVLLPHRRNGNGDGRRKR
jgi:proline dehydrogenase